MYPIHDLRHRFSFLSGTPVRWFDYIIVAYIIVVFSWATYNFLLATFATPRHALLCHHFTPLCLTLAEHSLTSLCPYNAIHRFSIAKQNLSSPCLYLTIIDCTMPLLSQHETVPRHTSPTLNNTIPCFAKTVRYTTLLCLYQTILDFAFPSLCHTSLFLSNASQ